MVILRREPPNGGVESRWGIKNHDFRPPSPTTQGHSYYEMPIATCMQSIEWCHFQLPSVTPDRFQGHDIIQCQVT